MRKLILVTVMVLGSGCSKTSSVMCGLGTMALNGMCVPSKDTCSTGTMNVMGQCEPATPALACGPGTHDEAGVCLADPKKDPMLDPTPWSKNVRVGSDDVSGTAPSIAVDSKGRIFVGFAVGSSFSSHVELWRSDDGQKFKRLLQTSSAPGNDFAVSSDGSLSVAIDSSDRVIATYGSANFSNGQGTISSAVSDDGDRFTTRVLAIINSSFDIPSVSLKTQPDGTVLVVWDDETGLNFASTTAGSGVPSMITLGSRFPGQMSFGGPILGAPALNGSHGPFALVEMYYFSGASGDSEATLAGWSVSSATQPAFTSKLSVTRHFMYQPNAALAADGNGHLRALFTNAVSRRIQIFETRADDAQGWTDPTHVFTDASEPTQDAPSLAADENGALHAIWCDTRSGGWLTYAADAPPNGDFGPAERVSEVQGLDDLNAFLAPLGTALAVRNGKKYAVWVDPRGGVYLSTAPTN